LSPTIIDWGYLKRAADRLPGFPAHGWAVTEDGFRLLWLPVNGLLWNFSPKTNLLMERGGVNALASARSHNETLHKLVIVLRELNGLRRRAAALPWTLEDPRALEEQQRISELATIDLELAYVYLRRIADRLIGAIRCLIVANPDSAPSSFTRLRARVVDPDKLKALGPTCDADQLAVVFRDYCGWFETLRGIRGRRRPDGLRELMEHWPVSVQLGGIQVGDAPPKLTAHLLHPTEEPRIRADLLAALSEIISGLCQFWGKLYPLLDERQSYDRADRVSVFGEDADITGFWPEMPVAEP